MWRRLLSFSLFLSLSLILSGCWDRKEVNDVAIVVGTAMDKEGDGYRKTVQIPLPGQLSGISGGGGGTSGTKSYLNHSAVGLTIEDITQKIQAALSRELYFSHRRVLLIGRSLAESGVGSIMDQLARSSESRLSTYVLVVNGKAQEALNADAPIERYPVEMIRELTQGYMKNPRTLKYFMDAVLTDGVEAVTPAIKVEKVKNGETGLDETVYKLDGVAIFKGYKMVGHFKDKDAEGLIWALGEAVNPVLTIPAPVGVGHLSFKIRENKVNITPIINGEAITMRIQIRGRGVLTENESNYSVTHDANLEKIEKHISEEIKSMVSKSITKLQQDLNADAIGFGYEIYRQKPKEWIKFSHHWDEIFPDVSFVVEPLIHIEHTNSLTTPFGWKEQNTER